MDFSSDGSEPEQNVVLEAAAPVVDYTLDPEDNAFINLLVRIVERCVLYSNVVERERNLCKHVAMRQDEADEPFSLLQRYSTLQEECLVDLFAENEQAHAALEDDLKIQKMELATYVDTIRQSSAERRSDLCRLYAAAQSFIDRRWTVDGDVAPGLDLDHKFCKSLSSLIARAAWVSDSRGRLIRMRKILLKTSASAKINSQAAGNKKQRTALRNYRRQESDLEVQSQNQLASEQNFFLEVVRPMLRRAHILPARRGSLQWSTSENLSSLKQKPEKSYGLGRSALAGDQPEPPVFRELLNRKAVLAKATATLDSLRREYTELLAEHLTTYSCVTKEAYDEAWRRDGKGYELQEAEAAAAVTAAEAAYQRALQEAEEAGITEIPPSPRDLGDRSEDGNVGSENEQADARRRFGKRKPETKQWIRRVARSGSPLSPSSRPPRPLEVSRRPRGNVKPNWPRDDEEVTPHKSRVRRYGKHQDAMRKRAEEQEAGRIATDIAVPSPSPSPPLPPPQRGWCIVL